MARIEPVPLREWPKEMRTALAALTPPEPRHPPMPTEDRPKALNTLGSFAHYPELAHAFFRFNGHVQRATTLSLRQREIIILRLATLRKVDYEWAQHVIMARDVGMTDEEIGRVAYGPDAPFLDPLEAAIIRSVDELIKDGAIGDETWAVLTKELSTQQVMDLIFTVGAYETIGFFMRSFAMDMDDYLRG